MNVRLLLAGLPGLLLFNCASNSTIDPQLIEPAPGLGEVALNRAELAPPEDQLLDVGIIVFGSAPQDNDAQRFGDWVFSEVRDNERHLLPFKLRETLVESNQWGAVRVLPEPDPSVDLLISGTMTVSDGNQLELQLQAEDSTGRIWLQEKYRDVAMENDYPEARILRRISPAELAVTSDPFQDLYKQIANDLLTARQNLGAAELATIRQVSLLVYANDLSPNSFGHMLRKDEQGRVSIASLPAADDPMIARVEDMRRRHHLFIDTVDEYYEALHEEMRSPYLIWRRYSFDQAQEERRAAERAADQGKYSSTTGYLTLTQRYDRYRWSKIYQQEFQELAAGFNREVAPAILELNQQVHGLSGTMEEQYGQWRRILREIFLLESGSGDSAQVR